MNGILLESRLMTVRILIADDEPNQLELLSFNLTQAGFSVTRRPMAFRRLIWPRSFSLILSSSTG